MRIDQHTELYGVLGYPIRHSLSPVMHNAAFSAKYINAVYLAFETPDIKGAIAGIRALGIKGMSVTIPYKEKIITYIDELDPTAEEIGAINTIVNQDGYLIGYNTDGIGALKALKENMKLKGTKCLIVGSGGAAKSIGFTLKHEGAEIIITNRTFNRGKELSDLLSCNSVPWEDINRIKADLIVQTTPVGMTPHIELCPIPEDILRPGMVVMDIIYNPMQTKLLKLALSKGCTTINGISMFVYQGAEQFMLWTGLKPPITIMKTTVEKALTRIMR